MIKSVSENVGQTSCLPVRVHPAARNTERGRPVNRSWKPAPHFQTGSKSSVSAVLIQRQQGRAEAFAQT